MLQGSEEQLSLVQGTLTVDWVRYAVATDRRTAKRSFLDILPVSSQLLASRMALGMDNAIFTAFGTATTALYAGDATSTATLDASDLLNCKALDRIKTYMDANLATPLQMSNGKQYYGLVISPWDAYNLRQDSVWSQAQRDANVRNEENPIFNGSMGVYNGIIIFVNKGVVNAASKSKCIAFGGEAIFRGYGLLPQFQTQSADYNFQQGVAVEAIYGSKLNNDVKTNFAIIETYASQTI
jgi:N4-gp56 family major capsid protein